jgi:hypothetical protein
LAQAFCFQRPNVEDLWILRHENLKALIAGLRQLLCLEKSRHTVLRINMGDSCNQEKGSLCQ